MWNFMQNLTWDVKSFKIFFRFDRKIYKGEVL